jgi:hypothetical protein
MLLVEPLYGLSFKKSKIQLLFSKVSEAVSRRYQERLPCSGEYNISYMSYIREKEAIRYFEGPNMSEILLPTIF